MTVTFDEVMGGYQAPRTSTSITLRSDLFAEIDRVGAELNRLDAEAVRNDSLNGGGEGRAELHARLVALTEEMRASKVEFIFEGVSSAALRRIEAEAYPTPNQKKEGLRFNPDTFFPRFIAASCVQPALTVEQVEQLLEVITEGQLDKLLTAANAATKGTDEIPKVLPLSTAQHAMSSATPSSEESPEASSSDE